MKLTRKIFSLFICLILSIAFASFSFTNRTQATNNVKWDNITPKTPPLAANDGASTYQYGYNYAWDGYYLHGMTSFADLVETKSDGSKVIHFFQFMPASSFGDGYHNQYGNTNYYAKGAIVHWSSDTQVWEKISPSWFSNYWTAYGGGFSVVKESYIDPATGSMWNGRLLLHTSYDFHQTYYYYGAYNYEGRLYARMNYPYYVGMYYPGKTRVIRWDGGSNWTDLWDQTGSNSSVVPGPNGAYSQQDYRGMSSGKYFIVSYNGSVYIATFKDRYCHTYNDPSCPSYYSSPYWDLKIYRYAGSLDALLNSPSPPQAWTEVWSYPYGSRSFSYGPPSIYEFKVLNDRFFLSTSTSSQQDYAYQSMGNNGWWFASTNNSPSTLQMGTTQGSSINAICGTIVASNYSGSYHYFPLTIPSGPYAGTYTGRINRYLWTPLNYLYPWGGGGTVYAYYWSYSWGSFYRGHFSGRRVKITGQPNGGYFDVVNMAGMYMYYSDATLWDMTTPLDEGPSPTAYEYYKGYLYAGFAKNSNLLRTNDFGNFANLSDLNTWDDCGTINDPTASPARPFEGGILALEKTTGVDEFGTPTDVALYIAGSYRNGSYNSNAWQYQGTCPLYSTAGEDAGGDPNALPLQFTLEEDEWRLNPGTISPNFQNRMYGIYDLYNSNLGLIAQFGVNSIPPGSTYTNHPEYRYRRFMLYNAPPSCNITQDPDPVVNERGTYTSFMLTFTPTGGFGSGNVNVELTLPENIYVPTEDSGGNPINQLYFSGSIPMNGGILNLPITIKSTNSAVVDSYRNDPESMVHITDLTANITVDGFLALDVIPPRPGFTVNANPSMFTLFQGECPSPTECCEDHCKQIDLDLEARNGFEDNVIIGTYWTDPPANQPDGVTFEFLQSSFVYDIFDTTGTGFTSLAEVRVRPDMGTRYAFQVRVSPDTLPGIYKFRIMFLSGSIKKQIDCTMTVLPPRPAIDVNPADGVGNFSMQIYTKEVIPGGSVRYRLKIQSKAGFTGKVALSLRGLPDQVYINNPSGFEGIVAEVPVPGYAQNYVDISPILDAYANVTLQTTPYTINPYPPTNLAVNSVNQNLNIISWDASRRGSRPIGGYEVWRSLTRYIDAATRIAVVNSPNTSYEDADVEPNTPYYYFVRAFDNDAPANFSTYATSGRVGEAASVTIVDDELDQVMATADKMGTIPGFYTLEVIGNGVGYGPGHVPTNPSAVTYLGLHVYRQDLNLKTPFLDVWGALALLFGMMLVAWQFVFRKKEEQTF